VIESAGFFNVGAEPTRAGHPASAALYGHQPSQRNRKGSSSILRRVKALIVTWEGGGVIQPAIGLGRELTDRGHDVSILAPAALEERVTRAGCSFRTWPRALEFDPSKGRSFEEQWPAFFRDVLLGPGLPVAMETEIVRFAPDVVIVDFMLRSALFEVERLGLPAVPLIHMSYRHFGLRDASEEPDAEWGWRWTYHRLNDVRSRMGLVPLPIGPDNPSVAIAARAPAAIVVMPREFDDWPDPPPNVRHVGPIFEERTPGSWNGPWSSDDPRPLVVVSLGTTSMHQEAVVARICVALAQLDVRVLLLTGEALDPVELAGLPEGVAVRGFVPHRAVLPGASVLVTHAGMGSLMAAFAAGVPTVCLPLGRDQAKNAQRALELGTSITVPEDAEVAGIAAAAGQALASSSMVASARGMQAAVRRYDAGRLAGEALESVVSAAA
jgi:MGT family glycosyltransferase